MSQARALTEIRRFLSTGEPEVLSISGRWGVGKTYAWDAALKAARRTTRLRSYAYVSAFGLKSLDALRAAIVQSTVSLDGVELEPTLASFKEHMSSFDGAKRLMAQASRRSIPAIGKAASTIPYVGKVADLITPGTELLIRNQIICIDDIERAGKGLEVSDILGLVSSLRTRRGCKIILLLNQDGLGDQADLYRDYLEKVVDQAVTFEPTPANSAEAALDPGDPLTPAIADRTKALGITNIRVIRRIRRFISHIEPLLTGLHAGVVEQIVASLTLLGWCVFEPKLAPDLKRIRGYNEFSGLFGNDDVVDDDRKTDLTLRMYGFQHFDAVDQLLLDGLEVGSFDPAALGAALKEADERFRQGDVQTEIDRPWSILRDSLEDDANALVRVMAEVIEKHGSDMSVTDASAALNLLRQLGRDDEAERLCEVYIKAQDGKPREFFRTGRDPFARTIDPKIEQAFQARLAEMPLERDPGALLLQIAETSGWNPSDVAFLASVPVEEYRGLLNRLKGKELHGVISAALRFAEIHGVGENERETARRMREALSQIASTSIINGIRLKGYLKDNRAEPTEPGA